MNLKLINFTNPSVAKCCWQHLNERRSIKKIKKVHLNFFWHAPLLGKVIRDDQTCPCIWQNTVSFGVSVSAFVLFGQFPYKWMKAIKTYIYCRKTQCVCSPQNLHVVLLPFWCLGLNKEAEINPLYEINVFVPPKSLHVVVLPFWASIKAAPIFSHLHSCSKSKGLHLQHA